MIYAVLGNFFFAILFGMIASYVQIFPEYYE